jgi:hypothetical protein
VIEVRERQVGADPSIFDGDDDLDGARGRVTGHLLRPQLPAEAEPPEEIAHGRVLHHFGWRDQGGEGDPSLAAVHHVMVVVAQARPGRDPHGRGVGVGRTDAQVARALVATDRRSSSSFQRGADSGPVSVSVCPHTAAGAASRRTGADRRHPFCARRLAPDHW